MQTQTTLSPETVKAIMESPATKAALAEAEAGRTAERGELLRALAEAELAAAVAGDEHNAKLAPLEKAFRAAQATADTARGARDRATLEAYAAGAAAEARVNGLRARLRPLGDAAIEAARAALALERRIAEGTLGWRTLTEWTAGGNGTRTEPSPGNVTANALIAAIDSALLELDTLERDGGKGPGEISRRITEIRGEIESAKAGAPTPRRGPYINLHDDERGRRLSSRVQR